MLHLLYKELVLFDLETTDINIADENKTYPDIIEIGGLRINSDFEVIEQFQCLVKPPDINGVTDYIENHTGITKEMLEDAKPFKEVWRPFAELTKYNKIPLCCWGTSFDIPVLKLSYLKNELGYPHDYRAYCIRSIVQGLCMSYGMRPKGFSLKNVREMLGAADHGSHRALSDSMTMLSILKELNKVDEKLWKDKMKNTT